MAFDTADARMIRAWAATLSETTDTDTPTMVVYLGFGGTIDFTGATATLKPPPSGTSSATFDVAGRELQKFHATFSVPIERAAVEAALGLTATGTTATYRYRLAGGPFVTVVQAVYDGESPTSKLTSVAMHREAA